VYIVMRARNILNKVSIVAQFKQQTAYADAKKHCSVV